MERVVGMVAGILGFFRGNFWFAYGFITGAILADFIEVFGEFQGRDACFLGLIAAVLRFGYWFYFL